MNAKRFTVKQRQGATNYSIEDYYGELLLNEGIYYKSNAEKLCKWLNEQHETIERLKHNIDELLSVNVEEELLKENEQLQQAYTQLKHRHSLLHDVCIDAECDRDSYLKDIASLEKENEQLQTRNDRQAKRLGELYEFMAKKDWESLTEIIDDFKRCEEQLQRESRTYGDWE